MSKTVEQFKKDYKALKDELTDRAEAAENYAQQVAHFSNLIKAACSTIGDEVQALIDSGMPGESLDAYVKASPPLKQMMDKIDQLQTTLEKVVETGKKIENDNNAFLKKGGDLIKAVKADVERRKAKEKGSKSLVEEEMLLKLLTNFAKDRAVEQLTGFVVESADRHRKQLKRYLDDEWKMTKEARISSRAREFMRRAFDERLLKSAVGLAEVTANELEKLVTVLKFHSAKAKAAKDPAIRTSALTQVEETKKKIKALEPKVSEVAKVAKLYEDGLEDEFIIGQLKYRENANQIRAQIAFIGPRRDYMTEIMRQLAQL